MASYPDRSPIASADLEACCRGGVADQSRGHSRLDGTVPAEGGHPVAGQIHCAIQSMCKRLDGFTPELLPIVVENLLVRQNRIEDAYDAGTHAVSAVVRHGKGFGGAFR